MIVRNSLILLALVGSWPGTAEAYCRTRTCDVGEGTCELGNDGCSVGTPIRWPNGCITFAVQRDGSPLQDISARDTVELAEDAFALWTDTECHRSGSPPLTFIAQGEVSCHTTEYNCDPKDWNGNVILFQDDEWVHSAAALAITNVSMNIDTGEILDADIEINTQGYEFALPGESRGADLRTVLTHEAGHVLGLNHAHIPGTVMHEVYDPPEVILSSLSDDDIAGICDIYGAAESDPKCKAPELPEDTDCVGASECVATSVEPGCTCRAGAPPGRAGGTTLGSVLVLAGVVAQRRRRAQRQSVSPRN